MKTFTKHPTPTIDWGLVRDDSGQERVYRDKFGNVYSSVTTFIGKHNSHDELNKWKEAVGETEATRICNAAADRGTAIHLACEQLVANEDWREISFVYKQDFLPLKKYLEANVDLVFASEHQMFSKTLKLAGTTDLIANHKGKFSILDYKTSSRIKYIDEIDNYFLQLAAYAVMLYERYQLKAEELTILMSIEGDPNVAVFSQPVIPWIKKLMKLIKENS